jgi:hypothetical protein
VLRKEDVYTPEDIQLFDPRGGTTDCSDSRARSLACLVRAGNGQPESVAA